MITEKPSLDYYRTYGIDEFVGWYITDATDFLLKNGWVADDFNPKNFQYQIFWENTTPRRISMNLEVFDGKVIASFIDDDIEF